MPARRGEVMDSKSVLLVDVKPPYLEALRDEARRRDLSLVSGAPDPILARESCLCVVDVSGAEEGAQRRVRKLLESERRVPVVALARDTDVDPAVALMKLGVADVIALPAPPYATRGAS